MFLPTNITLKLGDSGDFVSELQRRLSAVHCFQAEAINGFFDGNTVNGVSQFQSMSGIRADGIAGPETLRRLNGVIAGDASDPIDTHAATEEAIRHQQEQHMLMLQQEQLLAEQHYEQQLHAQQQHQQYAPEPAPQAYAPAVAQQYAPEIAAHYAPQPVTYTPNVAVQDHQQYAQAQAAQQQQPQVHHYAQQAPVAPQPQAQPQPQAPSAADMLAQMMQAQPQPAQQSQQQPQQSAQHAQQPQAQPYQQPAPQQQTQAPAPEQPRGIVGRAMQYANAMVEKLANYFESKLPAPVLQQVKEIGHTMARSGVQEATIPTGPEQQRGVDSPGRSQQQGKQIG